MKPYLLDTDFTLYNGDVQEVLRELPDGSVDCVVTSPPYWGLRDYGTGSWQGGDPGCDHIKGEMRRGISLADSPHSTRGGAKKISEVADIPYGETCMKCGATRNDRQLGLEDTPEQYVERMVEVFREIKRVLAAHGTVWLNLGDSYAAARSYQVRDNKHTEVGNNMASEIPAGLKQKDLVGIPWRVAFALQADGWYLRSDIIWAKPNPMPESITDRPTKAHEYIFLLSKNPRYYFDQEAVREPAEWNRWGDQTVPKYEGTQTATGWMKPKTKYELMMRGRTSYPSGNTTGNSLEGHVEHGGGGMPGHPNGRNIRTVWDIATQPYAEAHFATFPEELVRRALLAGCPEQVCVTCGKARERVVEKSGGAIGQSWHSHKDDHIRGARGSEVGQRRAADGWESGDYKRETLGFTDCGHDDFRPGVVLDPFIGSGTVALVARKHNRRCVGIELNPDYCELISRRTQQLSLLA